MDKPTEDVASQTDEGKDLPDDPVNESETDVVKLQTLNKQLYERAKRAETLAKELKSKFPAEVKAPEQTNTTPPTSAEAVDRLTLKIDGYTKDEVDSIIAAGGLKALENPVVKAGIDSIRAKREEAERSAAATPSDTVGSISVRGVKEEDIRKMSSEEMEKILPRGSRS